MNNRLFALLLALLGIAAFFTFQVPGFGFISARNLSLLMIDFAITATLAVGMLVVILPGHIDLSAGSGVGLTGGIAAVTAAQPLGIGAWCVTPLAWLAHWSRAFALDDPAVWLEARTAEVTQYFITLDATRPWLHVPLAMCGALLVALILWRMMGSLIVRQRIPAFIITLGGLLVFKGLFWLVIQNHTVPISVAGAGGEIIAHWAWLKELCGLDSLLIFTFSGNAYSMLTTGYLGPLVGYALAAFVIFVLTIALLRSRDARIAHGLAADDGEVAFLKIFIAAQLIVLFVLITNQFRGVPLPAVILGVVALGVWLLTQHTPWGRHLYAIGGNEEAALISGIPIARVTIGAFTLMGAIVALTGLMQTAYGGASTTTVGDLMELDAVAACVIGGTSLKGGRGTVLGVLFGALIMAGLINGLTLMAVNPEVKFIARGAVLIAAVWMDTRLSRQVAG